MSVIPVSLNRIQNALESRRDGQLLYDWLNALGGVGGTQADLIFDAATRVAAVAGVVAVTQAAHRIDGEGGAADTITSLTGGTAEELVYIRQDDFAGAPLLFQHGVGADLIACPGAQNIQMAAANDFLVVYYNGTQWIVVGWNTLALGAGGLGRALALTTTGNGAALVGIEDVASIYAAATVEAALAEVMVQSNVNQDKGSDQGSIPVWSVNMATEPTAADTLTIGADVYEFVATAGAVSNDTFIAVELTGVVGDTRDNLVLAINAADADNLHDNITNIATTAPALANGTENVLAVESGTTVVCTTAGAPGGVRTPSDPSIVLAEALTPAADIWSFGNVNVNTFAGKAKVAREYAVTSVAITAAMITLGTIRIDFPWQPAHFQVTILTSAGVARNTQNDTVAATANGVLLTLAGGGAPDIQATDVVTVAAWE